jgi:hypothetical protein
MLVTEHPYTNSKSENKMKGTNTKCLDLFIGLFYLVFSKPACIAITSYPVPMLSSDPLLSILPFA